MKLLFIIVFAITMSACSSVGTQKESTKRTIASEPIKHTFRNFDKFSEYDFQFVFKNDCSTTETPIVIDKENTNQQVDILTPSNCPATVSVAQNGTNILNIDIELSKVFWNEKIDAKDIFKPIEIFLPENVFRRNTNVTVESIDLYARSSNSASNSLMFKKSFTSTSEEKSLKFIWPKRIQDINIGYSLNLHNNRTNQFMVFNAIDPSSEITISPYKNILLKLSIIGEGSINLDIDDQHD